MRGDGVGIGHIGAVQGRAGGIGDAAGGNDAQGAIGERDGGVVSRLCCFECSEILERDGCRGRVSDGAWE